MSLIPKKLHRVWDDDKIKKTEKGWKCLWCNQGWSGQAANRALSHVTRIKLYGSDGISFCSGKIDEEHLVKYKELLLKLNNKRDRKIVVAKNRMISHEHNTVSLATEMSNKKHKSNDHASVHGGSDISSLTFSMKPPANQTNNTNIGTIASLFSKMDEEKKKKNVNDFSQTRIEFTDKNTIRSVTTQENADAAIADFILSKGLPFSLTSDTKFTNMLHHVRFSSIDYKPPSRHLISGKYLDFLYTAYVNDCLKKLDSKVNYFGLSVMGDGATIRKKPLFNVIICGVFCPVYVAKVHDCTDDLKTGENKNALFIANLCRNAMAQVPGYKHVFDLAFFDGASNVQKAGELLEIYFPRMSTIHGSEHVLSLFCQDLLRNTNLKILLRIYWIVYSVFGSGQHHMSYALFSDFTFKENNRKIGLIRAAGTRMAGWFYSFHRMLRLRRCLKKTVESDVWENDIVFQKKELKQKIEMIVNNEDYFNAIRGVVVVLFPVVKCLHLSDSDSPGMDKLHYFNQETTRRLNLVSTKLDSIDFDALKVLQKDSAQFVQAEDDNGDVLDDTDERTESNSNVLSNQIMHHWNIRSKKLESDFCISGWLLSIDPVIYEDAKKNMSPNDEASLRRTAEKLFKHLNPETIDRHVNKCMEDFQNFRNKLGIFANPNWWASEYCTKGQSHLWHATFPHEHCRDFAFVACRVTSKTLGIGSCERQWADIEECQKARRSHISSKKLEKQSVLYGRHCLEVARDKKEVQGEHYWGPEDLNDQRLNEELDAYMDDTLSWITDAHNPPNFTEHVDVFDPNVKVVKQFRAYLEDWELELTHKNTPEAHMRLLAKYGNMKYVWPESCTEFQKYASVVSDDFLVWRKKSNDHKPDEDTGWGWTCVLVPKGQVYDSNRFSEYELETINSPCSDFHDLIALSTQDDDVVVLDVMDREVKPEVLHKRIFPQIQFVRWHEYPDCNRKNPRIKL